MKTKQTIASYIGSNTNRFFKIPAYQRGYKWGELKSDGSCDASILVQDLLNALKNQKQEYFIQGVTVYENGSDVVLIDGQQRTTTLFLLVTLLCTPEEITSFLFYNGEFKLKYNIRKQSEEFLIKHCHQKNPEPDSQDEFFMQQAFEKMKEVLDKEVPNTKEKLKNYLLDNVVLFYIQIPEEQATRVFSMLNGAKAFMTTDELVKSSFLSEASKVTSKKLESNSLSQTIDNLKAQIGEEWQTTTERSRYARQWDKWMYWWNKPEIRTFFFTESNPMGHLIKVFFEEKNATRYSNNPQDVAVVFKSFQNQFIKNPKAAKQNFEALRKLQKKFEDLYNDYTTYNYLGLVLAITDKKFRNNHIRFFLDHFRDKEHLKTYTLNTIIGFTPKQGDTTEAKNAEAKKAKLDEVFELLALSDVYNNKDAKEYAFGWLFALNVFAANDRKIKFEFFYTQKEQLESFYGNKSLEHVWPKSRVAYKTEEKLKVTTEKGQETTIKKIPKGYLSRSDFDENVSEHSIGNLLFLHKNDNSKFNAKLPDDKKRVYFNLDEPIYSRNLLHTMSVFAVESWSIDKAIENIKQNRDLILNRFKKEYGYDD